MDCATLLENPAPFVFPHRPLIAGQINGPQGVERTIALPRAASSKHRPRVANIGHHEFVAVAVASHGCGAGALRIDGMAALDPFLSFCIRTLQCRCRLRVEILAGVETPGQLRPGVLGDTLALFSVAIQDC